MTAATATPTATATGGVTATGVATGREPVDTVTGRPVCEALAALRAAALPVAAAAAGRHPRHARRPGSGACLPGCARCELDALLRELGTADPAWTLLTTTRPPADVRVRCEVAS